MPASRERSVRVALRGRVRVEWMLVALALTACSLSGPKRQTRQEMLQQDLRRFHWALLGRDLPAALCHVRPEDRDAWEVTLECLLGRFRLVDFRVEGAKVAEDAGEATVRVRWTSHPQNSLVAQELAWKERWAFRPGERRWRLEPPSVAVEGLPAGCLPDEPEPNAGEVPSGG